jgi:hypothetical protein
MRGFFQPSPGSKSNRGGQMKYSYMIAGRLIRPVILFFLLTARMAYADSGVLPLPDPVPDQLPDSDGLKKRYTDMIIYASDLSGRMVKQQADCANVVQGTKEYADCITEKNNLLDEYKAYVETLKNYKSDLSLAEANAFRDAPHDIPPTGRAIYDALVTKTHGKSGIDNAALIQRNGFNPELDSSLEIARRQICKGFDEQGNYTGTIPDSIVIPNSSGQNEVVKVPDEVAKKPFFQRLTAERSALQDQIKDAQSKIDTIKADPNYGRDPEGHDLTKVFNLHNAIESMRWMDHADSNKQDDMVHFKPVDVDSPPPAKGPSIDDSHVPSPKF